MPDIPAMTWILDIPYGATGLVLLVALQRLAELLHARRNTAALLAAGAYEAGATHYPFIVALHTTWLGAVLWFGINNGAHLGWLGIFLLMQPARLWVILTLGPRWTTRIIVLPGAPPVKTGPYRLIAHPNYLIVAIEIAVLPMVFGLTAVAVAFSVLNALIMAVRIRTENTALRTTLTHGSDGFAPRPFSGDSFAMQDQQARADDDS